MLDGVAVLTLADSVGDESGELLGQMEQIKRLVQRPGPPPAPLQREHMSNSWVREGAVEHEVV